MPLSRQRLMSRSCLHTPAFSVAQPHSRKYPPATSHSKTLSTGASSTDDCVGIPNRFQAAKKPRNSPTLSLEPRLVAVSHLSQCPHNKSPLETYPTILSAISTTSTLELKSGAEGLRAGRVKELDEIAKTLDFIHVHE
jgi:hypothetical protein